MSLRQFLKDVPLCGTIEYEHRVHPYKPSSHVPRFAEDNFLKYKKKQREKLLKQQYFESKKRSKTRTVVDAETGEKHILTKSVWSSEEGQLGNDMKTIMGRGTGHLDIFRADDADEVEEERTVAMTSHVPSETYSKYMEDGPLNEYVHSDWSPDKKINERKLLKEATSPQISPSRQQSNAPSRVASRQAISARATPRSRVPSRDDASVFGTASSIAELELKPNSAESADKADICANHPNDIVIAEGDETLASDDNWTFSDGHSVSDALSFTNEDDEVIEFDFVKTEQQLYRELKRAALYINGTQPTGKRKSREEVEKTSRDIAHTKAVGYRDVYNAVCDEKFRDEKRQADLLVLLDEKDRKSMRAKHAAERRAAKMYIKQIQYDNEVILIRKMKAEKFLW